MKMPLFRSTAAATIVAAAVLATCAAAGETVTAEPDALLDYIEATGSQYIDTGVNAETGLKAVSQPIEVTLFDEHPEWGYKVEGLGAGHDEMALVFTNQNASSMAWTVLADLTDVQFLVVGGGGGGGADYNPNSGSAPFLGGGGGGGGGVVTGVVSTVVSNTEFTIKVGDGGTGFDRDPIPDESVEYFTGDPTFNLVTASNDTITQTAVATMNSSVTAKFFKAEIGVIIPYEPEEPWEPEPEPEPDPEPDPEE